VYFEFQKAKEKGLGAGRPRWKALEVLQSELTAQKRALEVLRFYEF